MSLSEPATKPNKKKKFHDTHSRKMEGRRKDRGYHENYKK
jgi:hypothetical protein